MYTKIICFSLSLFSLSLLSCKKDDNVLDDKINEEEVITTVKLTFTNTANSNDIITATYKDTDGDGGMDATEFDTIALTNSTNYTLSIELLDESDASDVDTITAEVLEEGEEHQFFFGGTAFSNGVTHSYSDTDESNLPIGLENAISTSSTTATNTTFTITLRHEPNKSATDVSSGDITNAGGETDIELSFVLDILSGV